MEIKDVTSFVTKCVDYLGQKKEVAFEGITKFGQFLGRNITWVRNSYPLAFTVGSASITALAVLYVGYRTYGYFTAKKPEGIVDQMANKIETLRKANIEEIDQASNEVADELFNEMIDGLIVEYKEFKDECEAHKNDLIQMDEINEAYKKVVELHIVKQIPSDHEAEISRLTVKNDKTEQEIAILDLLIKGRFLNKFRDQDGKVQKRSEVMKILDAKHVEILKKDSEFSALMNKQ